MEDGIERSSLNLHTNKTDKEDKEKINDLLYVYIPEGGEWEDFIIINNREKAVELIKKNKGRIEIFKKEFYGVYKPTYTCLSINNKHNEN
jgi:hypothetical protein